VLLHFDSAGLARPRATQSFSFCPAHIVRGGNLHVPDVEETPRVLGDQQAHEQCSSLQRTASPVERRSFSEGAGSVEWAVRRVVVIRVVARSTQ
jgi:hypothetical protein